MRSPSLIVAVCLACAARGAAQDMVFGIDEAGPDPGYAGGGAPSQALVTALQKYDLGRYEEAAVLLQRVVEGGTEDAPSRIEQAQFFLGKALLRLGFLRSALAIFDELAAQPRAHAYRAQSIPWLLDLAQRMPDSAPVLDAIARYDRAELEQAASTLEPARAAELWLLSGRAALEAAELERAVEHLGRVGPDATPYLRAQFLSGIAHVRKRRARPAIAAFQRLIEASDRAGAEDAERMKNLGWLALGRVYYTAGFGAGDREQGLLLGNAVEAWSRVDESSDEWLDALFESAWALFVADQHSRALGNLHALLSPFFRDAFFPEAHVLRSVIFFDSCQMDNAAAELTRFHQRYDPVREELERLLAGDFGPEPALALLERVNHGGDGLSPRAYSVLGKALRDRELHRALEVHDALDAEERLLARAPSGLRSSSLGERIRQDVLVARALERERLGLLVQARVERLLRELHEVANQADTIEIEILHYLRGEVGVPPATPPASGRSVHVDAEHVLWPFEGEYWRDELGYYRQELTDRCRPR